MLHFDDGGNSTATRYRNAVWESFDQFYRTTPFPSHDITWGRRSLSGIMLLSDTIANHLIRDLAAFKRSPLVVIYNLNPQYTLGRQITIRFGENDDA